ncbi:MAG: ABC transporter substrate-binding protein [Gemmatimonadota bacterium]|nr:MAG: ABC transporter substrate-binding protein [Gemmatimonadota bacterium]
MLDRPRLTAPRFDPTGLDSGAVDAAVREAMATAGSVYRIDEESLRAARPDLVLTQAVCEVCAVPASDAQVAVANLGSGATVLSLDAHTIEGIFETIRQVGAAANVADKANRYVAELEGRLARVSGRVKAEPRLTVLGLEWLEPPFIPGHWVPQMIESAGAINLLGAAGARSRGANWDELLGLDPDVLLIMPCGYDLEASRRDANRYADRLLSVAPRAIEEGRAFVVDASSYFNRSGPRFVDGVEILAALLHPHVFPDARLEGRGARWTPPTRNQSMA